MSTPRLRETLAKALDAVVLREPSEWDGRTAEEVADDIIVEMGPALAARTEGLLGDYWARYCFRCRSDVWQGAAYHPKADCPMTQEQWMGEP
jgi:hypothetical protein